VLDLLGALATEDARRAGRALRELLASFDQRLAEPLRRWEAEQAAQAGGRRAPEQSRGWPSSNTF
jgi:hypothetical protein